MSARGYILASTSAGMGSKRTTILSEAQSPDPLITKRLLPCSQKKMEGAREGEGGGVSTSCVPKASRGAKGE